MITAPVEEFSHEKIKTIEELTPIIAEQSKTVGLCHGGFDLLHAGHAKYFLLAKQQCDLLVVSVTSDEFVSKRKGTGRPILSDQLRAYTIACMQAADYVVIAPYERATEVIQAIKPALYFRGPDYVGKSTPGITQETKDIEQVGGKLVCLKMCKLSTTAIINDIKSNVP